VSAVEKQKELQQQCDENKIHKDVVLASTTEPQHANLYVYIYIYIYI